MSQQKTKKSNKQFMILSAMGIFFVVDAHAWSPFAILGNIMPYNSFFMPMFLFISGYFFKKEKLAHFGIYIWSKVKTLLLPFLIWNFVYGVLVNLLKNGGVIHYGEDLSIWSIFVEPFLSCEQFSINSPGWFVPALFMVVLVYAVLRKILGRIWNEYIMTALLLVACYFCVAYSRRGYCTDLKLLPLLKTGFLLFFYELGVFYKAHLENVFQRLPKIGMLVLPVLVNALICHYSYDLNFVGIATMSGFVTDYYWIPIVTSITGIVFWMTVAAILVPALGENKLVNYVSDHTFTIMMHHIFFFNVYNVILYVLSKTIVDIPFDTAVFRTTAWYRYDPIRAYAVWYVMFGVFGPLITVWLAGKIKDCIIGNFIVKSKDVNEKECK